MGAEGLGLAESKRGVWFWLNRHSICTPLFVLERTSSFVSGGGKPFFTPKFWSPGFQENVNSGATAAIAWGFLGTARGILSSYWRYMVRDDGGVKYRGAMLPGYGRMLTVLAQYISTADDSSILSADTDEGQDISRHVDAVVAMIEKRTGFPKHNRSKGSRQR